MYIGGVIGILVLIAYAVTQLWPEPPPYEYKPRPTVFVPSNLSKEDSDWLKSNKELVEGE